MKKRGFTLIELLAVIVILAIIALITTPTILGVIEKAKKGSAESGAYGYIDAVDKYLMTYSMSNNIEDGTYKASDLNVEYKGKGPENAIITIEKSSVKEAKICINDYSFDYDGTEVTSSVNNYCSNNYKVSLVIDEEKQEKNIEESSTTFEISDLTGKTNIVCNNGATPTIENNTLTISNIYGNTTCYINSSLEDTINDLDNSETNILMINNETISNGTIMDNKKVILNLNNKKIYGPANMFYVKKGFFKLFGDGLIFSNGTTAANGAIKMYGYNNSNLIIEGNKCNSTDIDEYSSGLLIYSANGNKAISVYSSSNIENTPANLSINGGCFVAKNTTAISINNNLNVAINNAIVESMSSSSIVFGTSASSISNLYINNSKIISPINALSISASTEKPNIYICNSQLEGLKYDIVNSSLGTINYSSSVIFTDGTNTPNVSNSSGTINANYTGTCLSS